MLRFFKLVYNFIIPIVTTILGTFLASWLLIQYSQPQLVLYTDGYYQKVKDISIGEFYIVNEGRNQEKNITFSINKEVPQSSFSISYTNSSFNYQVKSGYTYVTIEKLNPKEGAEIVFQIKTEEPSFQIEDFNSNSGNTSQRPWISTNPWWYLTKLQTVLVAFLIVVGFTIGFYIGLWKNDLIKKRKRKNGSPL